MERAEKKVLFYGAGEYAVMIYRHARRKSAAYGEPKAFIDGDVYKQGHQLFGLDVVSWEKAKEQYGEDFYIYITANSTTAPNIIGFLLESGVVPERIINYEPVEKRLGCSSAESYLCLRPLGNTIEYCICAGTEANATISGHLKEYVVSSEDASEHSSIKKGLAHIAEERKKILDGDKEGRHNCINYKVQYYYSNYKLRNFTFEGTAPCNFNCCYCCLNDKYFRPIEYNGYKICENILHYLEENKHIDENTVINLSSGEFSISSSGRRLMELVAKYPVRIFTNAYILSREAIQALKNSSMIFCSVDAGTKETFQRVKGVDGFEQVTENLKEYAKYGPITLKYILLDGVNDSQEDLEGFFALADEVATRVNLSRDFMNLSNNFSEKSLKFAAQFIKHFRESGILNMSMKGFLRKGEEEILEKWMKE